MFLLTNYETVTMPQYFHKVKLHGSFITTVYNVSDGYFGRDINVFYYEH